MAVVDCLLHDGFRTDGNAVITHDRENAFHKSAFAVAGGFPVVEEHAFKPCVGSKTVSKRLLKVTELFSIAGHDLSKESVPSGIIRIRIEPDRAYLCYVIIRSMLMRFTGSDIHSAVCTVKEIFIIIQYRH